MAKEPPRQRLKPNVYARMARFAAQQRNVLVALFAVVGVLLGSFAAATLRVDPDAAPRITLDETTERLQQQLDELFPGIEQTFLAVVESRDPETAREQAEALSTSLAQRPDLFLSVFVPGAGPFYDQNALLFRPVEDVRARVDQLLQMEPLYQAIATAPDIAGLSALVSEIGNAVEKGRSPDGLDSLLLAASAAIEGEVRGRKRPVDWIALAGLGGETRSMLWFVIATPKPGLEREAAQAARSASEGMTGVGWLWPRRALSTAPGPFQDFVVPAGLSVFVTFTLLAAGLASVRQTVALMMSGFVALATSAAAAAAMGRPLDAATWPFALAVLAPVIVCGLPICLSFGQARGKGVSAQQAVMLAAHRRGGLVTAFTFLFAAVWAAWLVRQLPSLSQLAMIGLVAAALAWICTMLFLPAALALLGGKPGDGDPHWLDATLAHRSHHVRNAHDVAAMIVFAAAVFSVAFLPAVRFGERQAETSGGPYLETPDARGAVHVIVPQGEVDRLVGVISALPEVGAIRTAAQFMPPEAAAKIVEMRRLGALNTFVPAEPAAQDEEALRESFVELERQLTLIASNLAAAPSLREAALRMRRAVNLFVNPQPPTASRVAALENALFGRLGELSAQAQRLAQLSEPRIDDLDPRLKSRFVSADGMWRIEVMPRADAGPLSFAAALRRSVPGASGQPLAALARNEIIHHETLLALAAALVGAAIVVLAALRSVLGFVLSFVPVMCFVTLTAALSVLLGLTINAALLAGISAVTAVAVAASMVIAIRHGGSSSAEGGPLPALRAGLLPPLGLAGATAPLALSGRPALADFGAMTALLLLMSALLGVLLVPALSRWLRALLGSRRATGREKH